MTVIHTLVPVSSHLATVNWPPLIWTMIWRAICYYYCYYYYYSFNTRQQFNSINISNYKLSIDANTHTYTQVQSNCADFSAAWNVCVAYMNHDHPESKSEQMKILWELFQFCISIKINVTDENAVPTSIIDHLTACFNSYYHTFIVRVFLCE